METEKGWLCSSLFKQGKMILVAEDSNHARKTCAGYLHTLPLFIHATRLYEADDMPTFYGTRGFKTFNVESSVKHLTDAKNERERRIAAQLRIEAEAKEKADKKLSKVSKSASERLPKSTSKTVKKAIKPKEATHTTSKKKPAAKTAKGKPDDKQ